MPVTDQRKQGLRASTERLDAAIFAQTCSYCGAAAGQACRQKPRGSKPAASTQNSHMARVRAGHAVWTAAGK